MRVEKDIVVNAPVERVYQLWTDFENFPRFMHHVEAVSRTGDKTLHWKAKLGPLDIEWDAEIRALVPNRTVTWHSTSGAENAGAVTLAAKGHITEMHVVIEYAPNLFEKVADLLTQEMRRSVEQDLERFKELAEGREVHAGTGSRAGATSEASASNQADGSSPVTASAPQDRLGATSGDVSTASSMAGSPRPASGSTSPEEIAAARSALSGTPSATTGTPGTGSGNSRPEQAATSASTDQGGPNSGPGSQGLPAGGNFLDTSVADAGGPPRNASAANEGQRADPNTRNPATGTGTSQATAEPASGTEGTMGGALPNDPTDGAGSTTTGTGPMGPSLMTWEAGTHPSADTFSTDRPAGTAGGASRSTADSSSGGASGTSGQSANDLGSVADDRTNVGSTTVSSGSLTDTGRAGAGGGMAGGTGPTTARRASDAGSGALGGGPSDMGGQAATPDLGSTPHGGGTGRGAGDAYGSTVATQGGPHSYAMPMPAESLPDTPPAGDDAQTTSGLDRQARSTPPPAPADQAAPPGVGEAGPADRDTEAPTADASIGGTGANYTGGTGGWGTEAADSPGTTGWRPSASDQ